MSSNPFRKISGTVINTAIVGDTSPSKVTPETTEESSVDGGNDRSEDFEVLLDYFGQSPCTRGLLSCFAERSLAQRLLSGVGSPPSGGDESNGFSDILRGGSNINRWGKFVGGGVKSLTEGYRPAEEGTALSPKGGRVSASARIRAMPSAKVMHTQATTTRGGVDCERTASQAEGGGAEGRPSAIKRLSMGFASDPPQMSASPKVAPNALFGGVLSPKGGLEDVLKGGAAGPVDVAIGLTRARRRLSKEWTRSRTVANIREISANVENDRATACSVNTGVAAINRPQHATIRRANFLKNDYTIILFDLATTGLKPKSDRVIQLAAKVRGRKALLSSYSSSSGTPSR